MAKKALSARKITLTISGWTIGFIFIAPYVEMMLTSLKGHSDLLAIPTNILPQGWNWSNFKTKQHKGNLV